VPSYLRKDGDTDQRLGASLLSGELELPCLVLKNAELEHNIEAMRAYCASNGVSIAPHVKTTMAPAIIRRQLAAGAWGVTVATMQQLRVCLDLGTERILLANELVDAAAAARLAYELSERPSQEVYCLVDSVSGVDRLAHGLRASGTERKLPVLIELGVMNGRTGCRTLPEAATIARAVARNEELSLAGVEGFEGILGKSRSREELARVDEFLKTITCGARQLEGAGLFGDAPEVVLSAGGSMYFDRVVEIFNSAKLGRPCRVVLRSGCYVTHDHGNYVDPPPLPAAGGGNELRPALELWSEIVSVPEPGRAIAGFGRRNAPFDAGLPVVLAKLSPGCTRLEPCTYPAVTGLNDQHAYLDTSAGPALGVGDRVVLGIVHPCTAFDKWRQVLLIDETYSVLETIDTFF